MNSNEMEMIALIRKKDFLGLEQLIDLHGSIIIRTIHFILNQPSEKSYLEDVENEVFYKIWKNVAMFDEQKSSLTTWITTLTKNTALDFKRKIIRDQKMMPKEIVEDTSYEEEYFREEGFLSLVEELSVEDQLLFLKIYYYQEKPQIVAEEMGIETSVVYNRLSRGRKKLKEVLLTKEHRKENHHV